MQADETYFLYDPKEDLFETFTTADERDKVANDAIKDYLSDCWDLEVSNVVGGVITHVATQVDRTERPPDEEIDEDGIDGSGTYWGGDTEYMCDYQLKAPTVPEADFNDGVIYFASWLINNTEGEVVSEELVLLWITDAMSAVEQATPTPRSD